MTKFALAALVILTAACATAGPPTGAAHITGTITRVGSGGSTILVEERPQEPSGGAKAAVTVTSVTRIWGPSGNTVRLSPADLRVGAVVRVWFDGPVAESYPVQGKAADIALGR